METNFARLTQTRAVHYFFAMKKMTYKDAGVDIDAGENLIDRIKPMVASTMRPEVRAGVGGFASLVALPEGYKKPILVSGTDGVGTKLKVAFLSGEHSTIGIDLVAMCVNDILAIGAEPLFFLDYFACDKLSPEQGAEVISGITEGCRQAGCALVGGETAELPGFYQPGEYDLAGFAVGVVEQEKIITGENVRPGDIVLGIASNGAHSNGYSLIRAVVDKSGISLSNTPPGFGESLGATLLKPTQIYVRPVRALLSSLEVRSLAHITGGGLLENIPRTLPDGLGVELHANWPIPGLFQWISDQGPVAAREMYRTFNMGIGMTVVVDAGDVPKALAILEEQGALAYQIGRVMEQQSGNARVLIEGMD